MVAFSFSDHGFSTNLLSSVMSLGPRCVNVPYSEEHPGPPLSQRMMGSLVASLRLSITRRISFYRRQIVGSRSVASNMGPS